MEKLPRDIIENILFRLPAEAASEAKRVCTTWETFLSNYKSDKQGYLFFITKFGLDGHEYNHLFYGDEYEHYDHAKMNYYHSIETLARMEPHRFNIDGMVGSCNGLVCFRRNKEDGSLDSLQISNPLTGEYVLLPKLSTSSYAELFARNTATDDSIGFGYCCSTKKYKVVRIYNQKGHVNGHVQVYTVGEKWRDKGFVTFVSGCALQSLPGTYSCGALHWCHSNFSEIWAFDLEHEKFHYIPLPEDDGDNPHTVKLLDNPHSVRNNFCIVYFRTSCIDIWAHERDSTSSDTDESNPKQNYNDIRSWSWIMKFSIEYLGPDLFTPFAITRNEQLLLWYKQKILYCYDPETSTLNKLWKNKILCCSHAEAIPHVHSIVSLKDLGETDAKSYNTTAEKEVSASTEACGVVEQVGTCSLDEDSVKNIRDEAEVLAQPPEEKWTTYTRKKKKSNRKNGVIKQVETCSLNRSKIPESDSEVVNVDTFERLRVSNENEVKEEYRKDKDPEEAAEEEKVGDSIGLELMLPYENTQGNA